MFEMKIYVSHWCSPCTQTIKYLDKYYPYMKYLVVDVDESPEEGKNNKVKNVPTICLESQGIEVERHVGFSKEVLDMLVFKSTLY